MQLDDRWATLVLPLLFLLPWRTHSHSSYLSHVRCLMHFHKDMQLDAKFFDTQATLWSSHPVLHTHSYSVEGGLVIFVPCQIVDTFAERYEWKVLRYIVGDPGSPTSISLTGPWHTHSLPGCCPQADHSSLTSALALRSFSGTCFCSFTLFHPCLHSFTPHSLHARSATVQILLLFLVSQTENLLHNFVREICVDLKADMLGNVLTSSSSS